MHLYAIMVPCFVLLICHFFNWIFYTIKAIKHLI
jgi:hypothetical protein